MAHIAAVHSNQSSVANSTWRALAISAILQLSDEAKPKVQGRGEQHLHPNRPRASPDKNPQR
jgi:hypothetical protein